MEDFIINAIAQFGFPAIITFYLLTRTTKAIENNTKALHELKEELRRKNN